MAGNKRPRLTYVDVVLSCLLPELVEIILSKLPVKSLLRFKCVSKSWCSLISSRPFIKAHLENLKKDLSSFINKGHVYTLMTNGGTNFIFSLYSIRSLMHESCTNAIDIPLNDFGMSITIVGCHDGLCCMVVDRDVILLNPLTRKAKKFPANPIIIKDRIWICHPARRSMTRSGFGLDEVNQDYKVFICFNDRSIHIWSSKTNSWKIMQQYCLETISDKVGRFLNGKLHWLGRSDECSSMLIVSFDLGTELYDQPLELPSHTDGFFKLLGVLDGSLCVVCDDRRTKKDIWVLKEYGVKESLVKLISIPYASDPRHTELCMVMPFCISPEGKAVLIDGMSAFVRYDRETSRFKNLVIKHSEKCCKRHGCKYKRFSRADLMVESLVSPFFGDENEARVDD